MKYFFYLLLFSLFFFESCSSQKQNILRIGIDDSYPPLSFKDRGVLNGFDVDLLNAIAEKMNYRVEFKTLPFDKIEGALENQEIDLAAGGFSVSDERSSKFLFSTVYHKPNFCLIFNKSKSGNDLLNLDDIKEETKIGSQGQTIMDDFLKNFIDEKDNKNIFVVNFENNFDLLRAIKANKINAFITEDLQAELIIQNNQDLTYFVINADKETKKEEGYAFAFNKKNKKLLKIFNEKLKDLNDEGKIDILKLRWFSSYGIYANILK